MSRLKATKRKRAAQANIPNKIVKSTAIAILSPEQSPNTEPKSLNTLISEEELDVTVETLQTLTEYPNLIKSKACKDLRGAVYDFRQACTIGLNTSEDMSLTARITAALTDGNYTSALILLAEMRIRNETPKLGALCRWVRDLDVVSGLSMQVDGISKTRKPRSGKDLELLRVLDSVLRVTGPTDVGSQISLPSIDPISLQARWNLRDEHRNSVQVRKSVLDRSIFDECTPDTKQRFHEVEVTDGAQRKPPNLHPAVVYLSEEGTVSLSTIAPPTTYHNHPIVPNLSLIKDVLTADECKRIIAATESVGFLPDAPIKQDESEASILAHNVYWMVDQSFHDQLWERVQPYVPTHVSGKQARGINRRFRVYRYVPGAEYRCHIDGAWPPSGFNTVTKAYQYDSSPPGAKQSSLFTFLIYLNDEFEGGETTFFLPSIQDGIMNAYPVMPVMGSVAVFPHGEATGALLHEGTGVTRGAKYIIRTDVEYDVDSGRAQG
ncbi:prolyl 4-hydroxylase [Tothia fuscella]|uniref:Prolyl 4-hydroxylase n=1 Tax=Tothia fuscella TaxID=1048955 RepID=A0A9P4NM78_9PEZI|nr:prolyl 4-hydroxylase [Tothia fuscella]